MKDLFKTIIKDFYRRGLLAFQKRDLNIDLDTGKIITIIGPRRAGKTYLMYKLISKIPDLTNVIYINFEDERLEIGAKNLNLIIEAYFELYPDKKESELFLFFPLAIGHLCVNYIKKITFIVYRWKIKTN